MLGYIPSRERSLLKTFYEENYLYPMKEEIKWDTVKTVKKLAERVKSYRNDSYSKVVPIKVLNNKSDNHILDFPNNTLYISLADFNDTDNICKRIEEGNYNVLILNISQNSGGSVQKMLSIASFLITKPVDLCLNYRSRERKYSMHGNPNIEGKDICILTSKNTVSSAEILAYIIKEGNPNSSIKGERTYGKAEGQVSKISFKYKYVFCLTAYIWLVNGLNCEQLIEKYNNDFDDKAADISEYLKIFEAELKNK
ncbi:S41 family peptidase [Ruminococcus flavefaciens]|uniref:S41 family peptidase n=1 Tax=Ruminococcus flavefaciens TaxID=1265 RepID=UPI0026F2B397|nr:S41 family peptidase [Ruminococcus flavefaciens]